MTKQDPDFWQHKSLAQMTRKEWDALCDRCGRCCLNKLEEEDTGEIFFTNVACKLLDLESCHCGDFNHRLRHVPDCLILDMDHPDYFKFLPDTCAYRLLAAGNSLPDWHPLVSGDPNSVHEAGISVRGWSISEETIRDDELEDHIIRFHN